VSLGETGSKLKSGLAPTGVLRQCWYYTTVSKEIIYARFAQKTNGVCPVREVSQQNDKGLRTEMGYYCLIPRIMEKHTISFRLDSDKLEALDTIAKALERDRTFVLNEAVRSYLDIQKWQIEHIKSSLRQAEAGELIDHDELKRSARHWRRR
jgi:predicted transcriptional regulator